MVGLIKNSKKVPYISLESFIDFDKLNESINELDEYRLKQEEHGSDILVGYKGTDWASPEFMQKVYKTLPKTFNYIMQFCDEIPAYNIIWTPSDHNFLLLHQDIKPITTWRPWDSLILNYKNHLTNSYHELLLNKEDFKIVDDVNKTNPHYNGLDYDYDAALKMEGDYESKIKSVYKFHLILSDTKTLFIYDNVTDTIHDIDSKAVVFNPMDYHDSFLPSWGYSIQFQMTPYFLNSEVKKYCEL